MFTSDRGRTPSARGTRCDVVCSGRGVGERCSPPAAHLLVEDRRPLRCQRHSDPLRDWPCRFREPRARCHVRPLQIRKQCSPTSIVRRLDRRPRRHRSRPGKHATCRFRRSHGSRCSTWRPCADRPFVCHTGRAPASSLTGSRSGERGADQRRVRCRRLPATASPISELHPLVARDRKGAPQAAARVPPAHCRLQPSVAAYLAHVQDEDAAGDLLAARADRLRPERKFNAVHGTDSSRRTATNPVSGHPALSTPPVLRTRLESGRFAICPLTVTCTTGIVDETEVRQSIGSHP